MIWATTSHMAPQAWCATVLSDAKAFAKYVILTFIWRATVINVDLIGLALRTYTGHHCKLVFQLGAITDMTLRLTRCCTE